MPAAWLFQPVSRPRARARLYCFSHAGGGASAYRLWPAGLPADLDVAAVQLPGREGRLREPPIASIPAIVEGLLPALRAHADRPFAFFGHSMGAVVASELARALDGSGGPRPLHLFLSGRRPPHVPDPETPLHVLPDPTFVEELVRRYGGIPAEILQHADLMELLLPTIRADIRALETFRPGPRAPLPVPISAFGGADDRRTPRPHLEAWGGVTSAAFRVRVFPGAHFYLEACRDALLADLAACLAPALAAPSASEATA